MLYPAISHAPCPEISRTSAAKNITVIRYSTQDGPCEASANVIIKPQLQLPAQFRTQCVHILKSKVELTHQLQISNCKSPAKFAYLQRKERIIPESIIIEKEGKWYVVRNKRTGVASQERSPGEARENLKEAVSL